MPRLYMRGIGYLLLQILLIKPFLNDSGISSFCYILPLLDALHAASGAATLFSAFLFGFLMDLFYSSLGLHAFATVLMTYSGIQLFRWTQRSPQMHPFQNPIDFLQHLLLLLPLVLLHHLTLWGVEFGGNTSLISTLPRALQGALITTMVMVGRQIWGFLEHYLKKS